MILRLDTNYETAQEQLQLVLNNKANIVIGAMSLPLAHMGVINHYDISPVTDTTEDIMYSNMVLQLVYSLNLPATSGKTKIYTIECSKRIVLLTTAGDIYWHKVLRDKVWNGKYPTTVGVDIETGEVYVIYLYSSYIELQLFGVLNELDIEGVAVNLSEKTPYRIYIAYDALWKYASEEEGTRYLRDNLYIEFDCGRPVQVSLMSADEVIQYNNKQNSEKAEDEQLGKDI